jgi:hypothetical protein
VLGSQHPTPSTEQASVGLAALVISPMTFADIVAAYALRLAQRDGIACDDTAVHVGARFAGDDMD